MSVYLDPALDNQTKKNEKNNRLVFDNCYLSVSRYRVRVFRSWQASNWPSLHWSRDRLRDRNAPFFCFFIWSRYKHSFLAYKFLPGQAADIGKYPRPQGVKWNDPPGT